jgi:hypothetical protein
MSGDVFRFVAVLVALVAGSQLPGIMTTRIPGWRAWVVCAAFEVLIASKIVTTLSRIGAPVVWYGAPSLLLASVLILLYNASGTRRWARRFGRR